jgi:hypothetical protein
VDVYRWASHCTPASLQDGVALADMPAAVSNALASAARSPIFIGVAAILCVCVLAGAAITISLTTGHDDGGTQAGHYETVQVNSTQLSAILEDVRRHYPQITPSDDWSNVADWINRLPEAARETVPFNTTEGFFQNQWVRSLGQALEPTTALFLAATLLALQALLLS